MRWQAAFIAALLILPSPVGAGDGRQLFEGVLQGLIGAAAHAERQERIDRQHARDRRLIEDCLNQNEQACAAALQIPNLTPQGRAAVLGVLDEMARARDAAQSAYDQYVHHYNGCRDRGEVAACDAALAYPNVSQQDGTRLSAWRAQRGAEEAALERQARDAVAAQVWAVPAAVETASLEVPPEPAVAPVFPLPVLFAVAGVVAVLIGLGVWSRADRRFDSASAPIVPPPLPNSGLPLDIGTGRAAAPPLTGHFPTDVRRALAG